ncbi:MafI family immunity protein [Micromonospora sp. NPDC005237]|uniref:MafI family immunity protein n=1 Tax=unclassified Micromonospora TaxID=2617518 RepID=UPI0033BB81C6
MERYQHLRSLISHLLDESPLTSTDVIADVRHLMNVGEQELAFDTMCSWLYEDDLPITSAYYERLVSAAKELEMPRSISKLDELIAD